MKSNTLLIVDDEEYILQTLETILEDGGYNLLLANSGNEGLEIIKRADVQMIISDHRMQGMDGLKFLSETKKILPDAIRIMLTGYADVDTAIKAINECEVYRLIIKPWNNIELLNTVKQGVEYYNLQKELERLNRLIQSQNKELKEWNFKLEQKVTDKTRKIRGLFLDAIKSLVIALEAKDKYVEGHSRRVSEYATSICEKMQLPKKYTEGVKLGSLLHDIGKIGIRESILDKKRGLTKEEYDHIQTHVLIGERILGPIIKNETVIRIIRYHHERFDGAGYPDGLIGKAIPLEARIVAVADAYDALLSERSYRNATDSINAFKELRKYSGIQFDNEIVRIFHSCVAASNEDSS